MTSCADAVAAAAAVDYGVIRVARGRIIGVIDSSACLLSASVIVE